MFIAFIIGTAGSGKSLLTSSYSDWLRMERQNVITVNLDPAALILPYSPDVDVRDYVNFRRIMETYELGPNGALVMAADLIADKVEKLGEEIEKLESDIVLVDTPGQMELFSFRASGPYIVGEISKDTKAIIYLFDSVFSNDPLNYVSNLFLSTAVYTRFFIPQIHVLSKCDLLSRENVDQIYDWSEDPFSLEEAIDKNLTGTKRLLSRDVMNATHRLGVNFGLIPVSAKTNEGLINLNAALERIYSGGEKFTEIA